MGMCRGCQKVFPTQEMTEEGLCKTCSESPEAKEQAQEELVATTKFAYLKNSATGSEKQVSLGGSFFVWFFAIFIPFFRGDFVFMGISGMLVALAVFVPFMFIPANIFWIYMGFKYNDIYAKGLLKKGYVPSTDFDEKVLKYRKIY